MEPAELLIPYVPRLVIDWMREVPELGYRSIPGTLMFADISGFTDLTERLAHRGKFGAEEMGDILNGVFEQLLIPAYNYGAGLIKWGGDAGLFLFTEDDHTQRACKAAFEMQRVLKTAGRLQTSVGEVRLRMSIGIHSGDLEFLLVGTAHRELLVTGSAATAVSDMEKIADAGEIVVSTQTSHMLARSSPSTFGQPKGDGWLLAEAPEADIRLSPRPLIAPLSDLERVIAPGMRQHYLSGAVDTEHRQITVGFVQFAGADELLEKAGPDALQFAITEIVDIVHQAVSNNGLSLMDIDVYADGGKALLVAGAPNMLGDNEGRVLSAAREIHDSHCRLPIRIGVNSGRALSGNFGPPYRRTYSLVGDAVNLGARLMGKAAYGETIATPLVLQRCRTSYETQVLPPFAVKGKAAPIDAIRVGAPITSTGASSLDVLPLIGRDDEMEVLLEAARAVDLLRGRVVEITGPPGIGKSRLIDEVLSKLSWPAFRADGDIYGSTSSYQPFQRLLRHTISPALVVTGAPGDTVADALMRPTSASAPWLPLIGIVTGVDVPMTPEVEATDAAFRKQRLEEAFSNALSSVLNEPTVLVFNDTHLMDEATLDLLRRLVLDIEDRPWLILTTSRPQGVTSLPDLPSVQHIELQPLSAEAAEALLFSATSRSPLASHRMTTLARRAAGNPLFLQELAGGAIAGDDDETLPDSVEGLIAVRIDHLDPVRRRLLRTLAVLGVSIPRALAGRIIMEEDFGSIDDLDWTSLSEFLRADDDNRVNFLHQLTQEVAYEGLPHRRRKELHARTAAAIESMDGMSFEDRPSLLSLHTHFGGLYEASWLHSREAAQIARGRYANAEAATLFTRALAATTHLRNIEQSEIIEVCEQLTDIYDDMGEFSLAEIALKRARRYGSSELLQRARWLLKASILQERSGDWPQALRTLSRGLKILECDSTRRVSVLRSDFLARYSRIRMFQGKHREATLLSQRTIDEARSCENSHALAFGLQIRNWAAISLGLSGDIDELEQALVLFGEVNDRKGQSAVHGVLGMRAYYSGDWNRALVHYKSAEDLCHQIGNAWSAAIQLANQAEIYSDQGKLEEAAKALNEAIRVWRGARSFGDLAFGKYLLGRVASRSGDFDEAFGLFAEAREYFTQAGEAVEVLTIDAFIAECQLLRGDAKAALETSTSALDEVSQQKGLLPVVPLLQRIQGLAHLQLRQDDLARDALLRSLSSAQRRMAAHDIEQTLDALVASGLARDSNEQRQWMAELSAFASRS